MLLIACPDTCCGSQVMQSQLSHATQRAEVAEASIATMITEQQQAAIAADAHLQVLTFISMYVCRQVLMKLCLRSGP